MKLLLILLFMSFSVYGDEIITDDFSAEEQYQLELINDLRMNPTTSISKYNLDLNEGLLPGTILNTPTYPLAANNQLHKAARLHCEDMSTLGYFNHTSMSGKSPWTRITEAGYTDMGIAENIATTPDPDYSFRLYIFDTGIPSKGHRLNLLSRTATEIGISLCSGRSVQDFGVRYMGPVLTGVVFDDVNENSQYDINEGLSDVVAVYKNQTYRVTKAGGFNIPIEPNQSSTITFNSISKGTVTKTVVADYNNIHLDVLVSEFKLTQYENCSEFVSDLLITCSSYQGQYYKASLIPITLNPFVLKLKEATSITVIKNCGNITNQTLSLPCVKVNNLKYWGTWEIKDSLFYLTDYGLTAN